MDVAGNPGRESPGMSDAEADAGAAPSPVEAARAARLREVRAKRSISSGAAARKRRQNSLPLQTVPL